jgi:hypothetical protein
MSPASAWRLRRCRRKPIRSTALAVCRPFKVCRGCRQRNFSRRLGQLRPADANTLAHLDFGAQMGNRPVRPVGHGLFEQWCGHTAPLHPSPAAAEVRRSPLARRHRPWPNRCATTEPCPPARQTLQRSADRSSRPASAAQRVPDPPPRDHTIPQGHPSDALFVARCTGDLPPMPHPLELVSTANRKPARSLTNRRLLR